MKILAIDPSGNYGKEGMGTTGLAIMIDGEIESLHEIKASDFSSEVEYWDAIIQFIEKEWPDRVVCEGYKLYNHKGKEAKMQANSELQTPQLVGVLKYNAFRWDIPTIIQFASEAKTRWNEKVLVSLGVLEEKSGRYYWNGQLTNQHKRDAMKHAYHYWRYKK